MAQKTAKNQTKRLVEALLVVTARKGWESVTLEDVAKKSYISLKQYRDKTDLLPLLVSYMDDRMVEGFSPSSESLLHDRLFEILMARFDAVQKHRKAMQSIFKGVPKDPKAVCAVLPCLRASAGIVIDRTDMTGCKATNTLILFGVMAATLYVWMRDESDDLAPTMAALDKRLKQVERFFN